MKERFVAAKPGSYSFRLYHLDGHIDSHSFVELWFRGHGHWTSFFFLFFSHPSRARSLSGIAHPHNLSVGMFSAHRYGLSTSRKRI